MSDVIAFEGNEISNIPVINRPSYFLVNNYGRESYMTILEPIDDFASSPERKILAGAYKSVKQLANTFKEQVPIGSKAEGFDRKDTVEVFFMGFRWRWRPNHKSFYGNITVGYELLPLIARWIVLTGALDRIDNNSTDYLPIKYQGGTARGFGGNMSYDHDDYVTDEERAAEHTHFMQVLSEHTLKPVVHCMAGSVQRAAYLNFIPREVYTMYDKLLDSELKGNLSASKHVPAGKYVLRCEQDGIVMYVGAVYGGKELPEWAKLISSRNDNNIVISLIAITAKDADEANQLMESLA